MTNEEISKAFTENGIGGVRELHENELNKFANRITVISTFVLLGVTTLLIFANVVVQNERTKAKIEVNASQQFWSEKYANYCGKVVKHCQKEYNITQRIIDKAEIKIK